jgi:flagellin
MVMRVTSSKSILNELRQTKRETVKNTGRLASGSRIVKAADDAAGLGIAKKLEAMTRSKQMASRNTTDAISVMQVMEGGLGEMNNLAIRLRELAISAASDSISDTERKYVDAEALSSIREIDRINQTTEFGGNKLFQGTVNSLDIQIDGYAGQEGRLKINLKDLIHSSHALGIGDVRMDTKHRARLSLGKIDNAMREIGSSLAKIGSFSNRLATSVSKIGGDVVNTKAAMSRIQDADFAKETATKVSNEIKVDTQVSVLAQANNLNKNILKLVG